MKSSLPTFVCALCFLATVRAEPDNAVALDVASTPAHPRNSEGSFATLKSGRVIFCYSDFYGGSGDNSPARLAQVYSDDRGRTWSAPRTLLENGSNLNLMSVSLLRLASGKLALFYLTKKNPEECHPFMQVSRDEGGTWSAPVAIIPQLGYFILNNDRVVQTHSGRLIAPIAFEFENLSFGSSPDITMWYYSDDEGATWKNARTWWPMPIVSRSGLQEPGVVELADGSLFSWARTDQGRQFGFRSSDNGITWSAPQPTELMSPESPASIKRIPNSNALLAVYNDHSGRFPYPTANGAKTRTPLVAAVSFDGGRTWPARKLLENDPEFNYHYIAIHFVDDAVLLGYSLNQVGGAHQGNLRIRRVALSWLPRPDEVTSK